VVAFYRRFQGSTDLFRKAVSSRKRPFARSGHIVQNHMMARKLRSGTSNTTRSRWTGAICIALEVPLCSLLTSLKSTLVVLHYNEASKCSSGE